jgi:hypothetical protein
MVTKRQPQQPKPTVKKPENLDVKRADSIARRVIEKNVEWLKEMSKR